MLAAAALGALGVEIRARLVTILVLIAIYVPVTGAGPSIQRAGAMGAAGVVAALAGRPRSRWYAILLAAAVTLGLDPRACADVGPAAARQERPACGAAARAGEQGGERRGEDRDSDHRREAELPAWGNRGEDSPPLSRLRRPIAQQRNGAIGLFMPFPAC